MWQFSLLGVIVSRKPLFNAMEQYVRHNWKSVPAISLTYKGVFVLRFATEQDMLDMYDNGPWISMVFILYCCDNGSLV